MEASHPTPSGLWLPLVTPFRDGELDEASLRRLVRHYAGEPIDGLVLAATTGEGLTLDEEEVERLVALAAEELAAIGRRLPLFLGLSGSDTRKVGKALERTAAWPFDGYLVACPYYTRPSQEGMVRHFSALAEGTARPIVIYNIPYRTGVNLGNAAMLELAERPNIVGVKDCSADMAQSFDLLRCKPPGFAVLTGEDALFHPMLTQGAEGGIIASAHVETRAFAAVRALLLGGRWAWCAGRLARDLRPAAAAVRGAEPRADQALALACRLDRQPGSPAAHGARERRARRSDRARGGTAPDRGRRCLAVAFATASQDRSGSEAAPGSGAAIALSSKATAGQGGERTRREEVGRAWRW